MIRFRSKVYMRHATHPAAVDAATLLGQCDIRRGRRSGPGGQHRNKVETAIFITHHPTGVRAEATERRSQEENRRVAIARLRVNLAIEVRGDWSKHDPPSQLWISRCAGGRIAISPQHDDFPVILAEALDCLAGWEFHVAEAAEQLGCSTSQLTRLLKKEPRALQRLNDQRCGKGLTRLR